MGAIGPCLELGSTEAALRWGSVSESFVKEGLPGEIGKGWGSWGRKRNRPHGVGGIAGGSLSVSHTSVAICLELMFALQSHTQKTPDGSVRALALEQDGGH